jgi:hypothetical protein
MNYEKTISRTIVNGREVETLVTICEGRKISEVATDKDYYNYQALRETYERGQISDEQLNLILEGDNLKRFRKDGDFVREVMDSATMDARIAKTIEHEKKWEAAMILRRTNPKAWSFALNEIIGDIFPEIKTAVWSKGNSPVFLAGKGGSIPPTANSKIVKEACV